MKNPELFHRTVKYLIKALLNDTFDYGNCYACAVGHIVAGSMGLKVVKAYYESFKWVDIKGKEIQSLWGWVFCGGHIWHIDHKEGLKQLNSTGYSVGQLMQFEQEFRIGSKRKQDEDLYAGVIAVIEVLHEIHQEDLILVLK